MRYLPHVVTISSCSGRPSQTARTIVDRLRETINLHLYRNEHRYFVEKKTDLELQSPPRAERRTLAVDLAIIVIADPAQAAGPSQLYSAAPA